MEKSKLVLFTDTGPYECVSSSPLREYNILPDGSSKELPATLLAVEVNGKWGWINDFGNLIIPAEYDNSDATCYNGVIILRKNGKYGGLYRKDLTTAFSFRYTSLHRLYNNTYHACSTGGSSCLIKPGDIVLSNTNYFDFVFNDYQRWIKCSKFILNRLKIDVFLDLETCKEISELEFLNNNNKATRIKDFKEQFNLLTHSLYLKFNDKFCDCKHPVIIFNDVENYKYIVRDKGETPIDLLYNDNNARIIASYETIEEMVADGWVLD